MRLSDQFDFGTQVQRMSLMLTLLLIIVVIVIVVVFAVLYLRATIDSVLIIGVCSVLGEVATGSYGVVLVDVDVNRSLRVEFAAAISRREVV